VGVTRIVSATGRTRRGELVLILVIDLRLCRLRDFCIITKRFGCARRRNYCVFFETRAISSSNLESNNFKIGERFDLL
jgi:hypothetical protein